MYNFRAYLSALSHELNLSFNVEDFFQDNKERRKQLFIWRIPEGTTIPELREAFRSYGRITNIFIHKDKNTNEKKSCGHINFNEIYNGSIQSLVEATHNVVKINEKKLGTKICPWNRSNDGPDAADKYMKTNFKPTQSKNSSTTSSFSIILNECMVCMEPIEYHQNNNYSEEAKIPIALSCGHLFHQDCIDKWFQELRRRQGLNQGTCPTCKSKVEPKTKQLILDPKVIQEHLSTNCNLNPKETIAQLTIQNCDLESDITEMKKTSFLKSAKEVAIFCNDCKNEICGFNRLKKFNVHYVIPLAALIESDYKFEENPKELNRNNFCYGKNHQQKFQTLALKLACKMTPNCKNEIGRIALIYEPLEGPSNLKTSTESDDTYHKVVQVKCSNVIIKDKKTFKGDETSQTNWYKVDKKFTNTIRTWDTYYTEVADKIKFNKEILADANEPKTIESLILNDCTICEKDVQSDDQTEKPTALCCGHIFHKNCIDRWLKQGKSNCPTCKSTIRHDLRNLIIEPKVVRNLTELQRESLKEKNENLRKEKDDLELTLQKLTIEDDDNK